MEERLFHSLILEASGNQLPCEIAQGLLDRIWVIQNMSLMSRQRLMTAREQHLAIFEFLCSRNVCEAGQLMREHLVSAKEHAVNQVKDKSTFLSSMVTGPDK